MADMENPTMQDVKKSSLLTPTHDNNADLVELRETVMSLSYNDYIAVLQSFDTSSLSSQNIEERKRAAFYLELLIARGSMFVFDEKENPEERARTILSAIPLEEPIFAMFFANVAAIKEHMMAIDNANNYYGELLDDCDVVDKKYWEYKREYDKYVDGGIKSSDGLLGGIKRVIGFGSSKSDDVDGELLDRIHYYEDRIARNEQLRQQVVRDLTELKKTLERLTCMDKEFARRLTEYFSRFDM